MSTEATPTWRELGRRARRLGIRIEHGRHEASMRGPDWLECRFVLWATADDSIALRAAIAATLEQLEARR